MTYGTALFLIAVGAILRFAVTADADGFDINTAGTILMVIGVIGLVLSFLYAAMWSRRRRTDVVERPIIRERR
jgi:positive regulator of sigma E activity